MVCQSQNVSVKASSALSILLDIFLRKGGYVLIQSEIATFFDESYSAEITPLMCVAGYVFSKENANQLEEEWDELRKRFSLPFFRMSACAHGVRPFEKLNSDEQIEVEKAAIALINKRMSHGIAITVRPDEYIRIIGALRPCEHLGNSPYTFCARNCMVGVQYWADLAKSQDRIAYIFETGHSSHSEADNMMCQVFANETLRAKYRYAGHGFVPKDAAAGLQAADTLAWHWCLDRRKHFAGNEERRLDTKALFELRPTDYRVLHFDELMLRELAARQRRRDWSEEPIDIFK